MYILTFLYIYILSLLYNLATYKALPKYIIGSRQAEHKLRELIKESRVGNTLIQERDEPIGEEGAVGPRGTYKKVLTPSRRLGLVAAKSFFILPLVL